MKTEQLAAPADLPGTQDAIELYESVMKYYPAAEFTTVSSFQSSNTNLQTTRNSQGSR